MKWTFGLTMRAHIRKWPIFRLKVNFPLIVFDAHNLSYQNINTVTSLGMDW